VTDRSGLPTGSRASLVSGLRRLAEQARADLVPAERCDLCSVEIPDDHRHLLHVDERRIVCACQPCFFLLAGQGAYLPTGSRTVWLDDLDFPDALWHSFRIPIGLAILFRSSVTDGVVALYPSPAGATESELDLDAWQDLVGANPILGTLDADTEALVVNRLADPPQHAIAPIDECYRLIGLIRTSWRGLSGGRDVEAAVARFFDELAAEGAGAR
jgi:hypothetical protein